MKELRGRGGLRGGRRGKTIPSPKRNMSNSNSSRGSSGGSSVGARGKSPPKKPKLGRQREAFCPTTPTTSLATGGTIICSTPKNSRWGEETSTRARTGLELGDITPVRGLLGIGDKRERRERVVGRECKRRERYGGTDSVGRSIGEQSVGAGLVVGQAIDEQFHLWKIQKESGFYHRKKENQQNTLKEGREGERRWIDQRRQVESSRDTCSEVERLRERDLQNVDEKDKERERHLRQYHQQLQQFMPSSASSSVNLSPSTCPSFSSSNQASLSSTLSPSSCSSLQHSSHISLSALVYNGLEEVLDAYRARVEVRADGNREQLSFVPSGEICLQSETSPSHNTNKDKVGLGDSGGISEDWRVSLEGKQARFGQNRGKSEKGRSLKATGEGEERVRREDWRPAGMGGGGGRRCAWVATTETEQADRTTGARPADVEAQMSYNCDSEVGEEGSDVPVDGVWSTEEQGGADDSLVSTHSSIGSNSLFNHPAVESPQQRAPAERPLSPACEHTNTPLTPNNKLSNLNLKLKHTRRISNILPLPLQNAQQGVPSSSRRANARELLDAQSAKNSLSTPITQNRYKIPAEPLNILSENPDCTQVHTSRGPEVNAKISVLPQEETPSDSLSHVMDPLSISLLQVDQQVATASFLQGAQNNTSLCPLAKTKYPAISDTMTATNHTERRKGMHCATYEHCGIGKFEFSLCVCVLTSS